MREEVIRTKRRMNELMFKHTGQTLDKIESDTDRDNFMSAFRRGSFLAG